MAPPPPLIVGEPQVPEYYIIEPVDPGVVFVPIYDPYLVYGVWPYPTYRPFYWYPPGYVTLGVFAFGAPVVVGAALWATYDWRVRRVAIDVNRFNTFNRTALASPTWRHNPRHRGNLPYTNPVLQQQFGKTATGVQGLSKTGFGSNGLSKAGIATNPQLLPKGPTTKTGRDNINVNKNANLGNIKSLGNTTNTRTLPTRNQNVTVNRNVHVNRNVGGNVNVNRNVTLPRGNFGVQGAAKGAGKDAKHKGRW